jgi:hypothetical protein
MRLKAIGLLCALLTLAAVPASHAQSITTADLTGTWSVFQLATPATTFAGADVRSYRGSITVAAGVVTAGTLTDDQLHIFTVTTGTLTITAAGVVDGTLTLDDGMATPGLTLDIAEARLLLSKHTIVGASTILGHPGLFTLVKSAGPPFTLTDNLAGDWNYHEVTPSNQLTVPDHGDATWVKGTITFHDVPNAFCTEADLTLADGTVRATRAGPGSFL